MDPGKGNGGGNGNGASPALQADLVLGFTVPERNGRGRLARLDDTLNVILSAHDYPPPLARLLAEALILTVLIGSALRSGEGQTTLQARAEGGAVDLFACDYRAGELRGYLSFDDVRTRALAENPDLRALFGEGYLAVTIDQAKEEERYQGIVALEGETLCAAAQSYFISSEQIPTLLRAEVMEDSGSWRAGGMLLQHLPRGEEGRERLHASETHEDWQHLEALGATVTGAELANAALPFETLLWHLFNEDEVRTIPPVSLSRGCRCSVQHIEDVLGRMPPGEREAMRGENGLVLVDCEFCSRQFEVRV